MKIIEDINEVLDILSGFTNGNELLQKIKDEEAISIVLNNENNYQILCKNGNGLFYIYLDDNKEFNEFSDLNKHLNLGQV